MKTWTKSSYHLFTSVHLTVLRLKCIFFYLVHMLLHNYNINLSHWMKNRLNRTLMSCSIIIFHINIFYTIIIEVICIHMNKLTMRQLLNKKKNGNKDHENAKGCITYYRYQRKKDVLLYWRWTNSIRSVIHIKVA